MRRGHSVFIVCWLLLCYGSLSAKPENNRDSLHILSVGNNTMTISAQTGGRILSFTCNGKELLLPSSVHEVNYGATLWPSPQSDWGWPPYEVLDTDPYHVSFDGGELVLRSKPDTVSGYLFQKRFRVSTGDTAVNIEYSIYNMSSQVKQVAAWDVCRTAGGLCFFPVGEDAELPASSLESVKEENGILWYHFHKSLLSEPQKLFSTAREGWLAYLKDGLLFVKTFPDTYVSELAPGQGEVEIFAQKDGLYIELENHGPYTTLKPGEHLTYCEKWYLKEVDRSLVPDVLVEIVRELVK